MRKADFARGHAAKKGANRIGGGAGVDVGGGEAVLAHSTGEGIFVVKRDARFHRGSIRNQKPPRGKDSGGGLWRYSRFLRTMQQRRRKYRLCLRSSGRRVGRLKRPRHLRSDQSSARRKPAQDRARYRPTR